MPSLSPLSSLGLSQFQVYPCHTPKSSCQVLTFPLALATEQERTKLLKHSSVAKSVNSISLLGDLSPIIGKKSLHSWIKMLNTDTQSCPLHDPHLRDLNNSYKNRSPLRLIWGCWWWITTKTMKKEFSTLSIYTGLQKEHNSLIYWLKMCTTWVRSQLPWAWNWLNVFVWCWGKNR